MAIIPSFPTWHQTQELSAGMSAGCWGGAGAWQQQNVSLVPASAACVSLHCAAPIADIMQHSDILLLLPHAFEIISLQHSQHQFYSPKLGWHRIQAMHDNTFGKFHFYWKKIICSNAIVKVWPPPLLLSAMQQDGPLIVWWYAITHISFQQHSTALKCISQKAVSPVPGF